MFLFCYLDTKSISSRFVVTTTCTWLHLVPKSHAQAGARVVHGPLLELSDCVCFEKWGTPKHVIPNTSIQPCNLCHSKAKRPEAPSIKWTWRRLELQPGLSIRARILSRPRNCTLVLSFISLCTRGSSFSFSVVAKQLLNNRNSSSRSFYTGKNNRAQRA